MDQYQSELMSGLLEWWSATDTPVTLLTATMPAWQREKFHLSYTGKEPHFKGVFPSLEDWSTPSKNTETSQENIPTEAFTIPISIDKIAHNEIVDSHVQWVIEQRKLFPQARIGVICNTVGRAQSIAEALSHESPIVLHSRMTAGHRKEAATKLERAIGKKEQQTPPLLLALRQSRHPSILTLICSEPNSALPPLLFNAQEDCGDALIRKGRYVSQEWLGKNSPL
ncbi:hypothetical protein RBK71_07740 [Corynebacterium pseudotuberculosis]